MSPASSTVTQNNQCLGDLEAQRKDLSLSTTPTLCEKIDETKEVSDSESVAKADEHQLSSLRRNLILAVLASAQFFDIFNACAAMIALPELQADLGFKEGTIQWVISAYTLTFASFMLISGRISDMFHPKPVFVVGILLIGLLSIPIGASVNPIMAIILRAIQGIGAAMNIPSAISMIRSSFPDAAERSRAYAIYGTFGAIGNCLGFVLGGVISSKASWRWVFYLLAIVIVPFSAVSWFILPGASSSTEKPQKKSLDWPGVASLTIGLILFVFAISEGSTSGWNSATVIAPLVISIFTFASFFVIERIVQDPAVPPRTWTNKNFAALFFYGMTPYGWIFAVQVQLVELFTSLWGISTLSAALRSIPLGLAAGITSYLTGIFAPKVPKLVVLISGHVFMAVASILFAFADEESKYWSHVVPGMIVGMLGLGISYVGCTIVVMEGTREGEEGVVSAVIYTSYEIGATLGPAVAASITLGVNTKLAAGGDVNDFAGYAASFWALLGLNGVAILIVLLFVRK